MKDKKKIIIIVVILVVIAILCVPKKYQLKDGGTIVYEAKLWRYEKVHSMIENGGFRVGKRFKILGIEIIDDIKEEPRKTPQKTINIDPDYDFNTSVKLDGSYWEVEGLDYTYQFVSANTENGYIENLLNGDKVLSSTKGIYKVYTGTNITDYKANYAESQSHLRELFNSKTDGMNGNEFVLIIELDVKENSEAETGQQTRFVYYGLYTEEKMVLAEIASYDNVKVFNRKTMEVR